MLILEVAVAELREAKTAWSPAADGVMTMAARLVNIWKYTKLCTVFIGIKEQK